MKPNTQPGLSKAGANKLASQIRKFWKLKGYDVATTITQMPVADDPEDGAEGKVWMVQTDMSNGMPKEMARALAMQAWLVRTNSHVTTH